MNHTTLHEVKCTLYKSHYSSENQIQSAPEVVVSLMEYIPLSRETMLLIKWQFWNDWGIMKLL